MAPPVRILPGVRQGLAAGRRAGPAPPEEGHVTAAADQDAMRAHQDEMRGHQDAMRAHRAAVEALRRDYAAIPPGMPVRLAKRTSNLFRFRDPAGPGRARPRRGRGARPPAAGGLDVSPFGRVLNVDPGARTAVAGGMTTYEDLADATLAHGLMPLVVPELKTITLGGAVTGLGVESTSLRNGLPHESVTALEILTGDGRVIIATEANEHGALFRGFPNSYGTLGYALSLTIEL